MTRYALAIDIGASGGRHILGSHQNGKVETREVYRFPNGMHTQNGHDCWDVDALHGHVVEGMRRCKALGCIPSTVAIDSWGVDYVLLDEQGRRVGDAVAYRDSRTKGMDALLEKALPYDKHYALTGIAKQPNNTVYQLMADFAQNPSHKARAKRLAFLPCYLSYLLCGVMQNEYTIASTSALLNAQTRDWDDSVLEAAGIPRALMGDKPVPPATVLGGLKPELAKELGYDCKVMLSACHDTGSAFYAMPQTDGQAACISSGTWSLLGATLGEPVLTDAAREADFSNEGGVTGIRFLQNIIGLWLIQRLRAEWGERLSYAQMTELAFGGEGYAPTVNVLDGRFLKPESMERELRAALREAGAPAPANDAELLFCVLHSLAACYADAIRQLQRITGKRFTSVIITGGGSRNELLNRLTAEATGLPVTLGDAEGSALGNLMLQLGC